MIQKVLLIDDDDDDILIHSDIIEEVNSCDCIEVAYDGVQAIEKIKGWNSFATKNSDRTPDLIFLDINMPKMDGLEFLERFSHLPKDRKGAAKIVVLTTSNLPEDRKQAMRYSEVKDYIVKPLDTDRFQRLITELYPDK